MGIIMRPILTIEKNSLLFYRQLFKFNSLFKNMSLISITRIDYNNSENRFTIRYIFRGHGIIPRITLLVKTDELTPFESLNKLYPNAVWYERELWDLFGIFFLNNPNLCRVLSDYGSDGHPQRKDYPLTGYNQYQYDISEKRLMSVDVELRQYRR